MGDQSPIIRYGYFIVAHHETLSLSASIVLSALQKGYHGAYLEGAARTHRSDPVLQG